MKTILQLSATLAISGVLAAQTQQQPADAQLPQTDARGETDGEVIPVITSETVVPATEGDEGELRYPDRTPERPELFLEKPMPEVDRPHTGPDEAVVFDVATGRESYVELLDDPFAREGWMAGRTLAQDVPEPGMKSFGGLSQITSKSFPWSTHARIFFRQGGLNYVCSGTMIDPKYAITAGHCVHEGAGGNWSTNVSLAPAWDGDSNAFGTANAESLGSFTAWTSSGSWSGDMGFVRLDRPVGFLTGWMGTFYSNSNSYWAGTTFHMAGFPGGCFSGAPNRMYYGYGRFDSVGSSVVEASMYAPCWIGGMSGSGVYRISGGSRYVGGNLSHGWGKSLGITTRIGVARMTSGKYSWFHNSFKPAGYPSYTVDYVPLKVRSNSSVRRGYRLGNFSYRVYNTSNYNPPTRVVDTDVYLSTNSNISIYDTKIQDHSFTWNFGAKTGVTVRPSGPIIPYFTTPGSYYVGVIIDESDFKTSNNDTDGWDAQRITVTY